MVQKAAMKWYSKGDVPSPKNQNDFLTFVGYSRIPIFRIEINHTTMGEEVPIDYRYAEKVPGPLYTIRERDLTHIKPQILGVGEVLYCYGKKMICVRQAIYRD